MTPAEADQRIIHSRRVLTGYLAIGVVGEVDTLMLLISDEIIILENMAEEHPGKVAKLTRLGADWVAFREGLKAKMH